MLPWQFFCYKIIFTLVRIFFAKIFHSFDSNESTGGPPEKKQRRTQSVLVEQPSEDKILIDNISDGTMSMDEVGFSHALYNGFVVITKVLPLCST